MKIPAAEALFVVRLNAGTNEVVVGPRSALTTASLLLRNTNWLGEKPLTVVASDGLPVYVRLRSSQVPRAATLFSDPSGTCEVVLADGELGIATGQACVFYDAPGAGSVVLGGGFIAQTFKTSLKSDLKPLQKSPLADSPRVAAETLIATGHSSQ